MPTVRMPDGTFGVRATGGAGGAINFAPVTSIVIEAPAGGQGAGGGIDQQKMGEALVRQVNDAMEAKMGEFLATQKRAGGTLSPGMRI